MNDREKKEVSFEHVLRKACRASNPKNVLEWGPGRSTRMIAEECPGAKILCIEHEKVWFNRFNDNPVPNAKIILRSIDLRGGTSDGYITWPYYDIAVNGREKFDLIFIDGRFRFDCLVIASLVLSENGCVIIHDTHRTVYHRGYYLFKNKQEFPELRTTLLCNCNPDLFDDEKWMWCKGLDIKETFNIVSLLLKCGTPFYHVRFGDGELYCTENPMFANKRHQPRDERLSQEIKEALQIDAPPFQIAATMGGWNEGKLRGLRRILSKYFHEKTFYHVTFLHETFLHDFEAFKKFTELFQEKKVFLIGGPTVCDSKEVWNAFSVNTSIELSDTNAYYELDKNMGDITSMVNTHGIVISALGWASTVLAKRLWNLEIKTQFIDIGSVVDALAGVNTRGWIKKNWEYVQEKRKCFS